MDIVEQRKWIIEVPLSGPDDRWHELAECDTADIAGEVVRVLLSVHALQTSLTGHVLRVRPGL